VVAQSPPSRGPIPYESSSRRGAADPLRAMIACNHCCHPQVVKLLVYSACQVLIRFALDDPHLEVADRLLPRAFQLDVFVGASFVRWVDPVRSTRARHFSRSKRAVGMLVFRGNDQDRS
jgi:hypothetical protein